MVGQEGGEVWGEYLVGCLFSYSEVGRNLLKIINQFLH